MPATINLLNTDDNKRRSRAKKTQSKRKIINSSVLLLLILLIAASGVYAYKLVLAKESEVLDENIKTQKDIISSYKQVEERKSLLTLKTNEIKSIYDSKFDYLKAIDDAQHLFGFSIDIESIDIEKEGVVDVKSRKVSDITLDKEQAFSTNIKELNLTIVVPDSYELEDTIDTLLGFEGQGLSSVIVTSTTLNEGGDYEVVFSITFESTKDEVTTDLETDQQ